YRFAGSFKGAGRRMELVKADASRAIYRDFAHSPSKLSATIAAVREQFPNKKLIACFELHTFSSLSDAFLEQYESTMDSADVAIVYFNPEVIAHKKLKPITVEQVKSAFACNRLDVYMDPSSLKEKISKDFVNDSVLLMMSSGSFDGVDLAAIWG
ncbi:MAG: glutamate ligase domain-containing protein, partial [Bacteroidota bacterium]